MSVTAPRGFRAAGVACGIKASGALDLALVASTHPCTAAAVFTTNQIKAAPVRYDQVLLARRRTGFRAVIINSGNANACTGPAGGCRTSTPSWTWPGSSSDSRRTPSW
jgi:glutamate N-acetyltransferase/amino-acid N-acetyltransferase